MYEGFPTSEQEKVPEEIEFNYNNLSIDELRSKIREKGGGSMDIEPLFQGDKAYVLGEEINSVNPVILGPLTKKILLAKLLETDFSRAGIKTGDVIEVISIRGNTRRLNYLGEISSRGISVGVEKDGQVVSNVYYLDQIQSFKKAS